MHTLINVTFATAIVSILAIFGCIIVTELKGKSLGCKLR